MNFFPASFYFQNKLISRGVWSPQEAVFQNRLTMGDYSLHLTP